MSVPFSRAEAWSLLCEWTESDSLRRHMLAVETGMRAYAVAFGEDEELWGLTGLLHDLDYERYPDLETGHPRMALKELEERGVLVAGGPHGARQRNASLDDELLHERGLAGGPKR